MTISCLESHHDMMEFYKEWHFYKEENSNENLWKVFGKIDGTDSLAYVPHEVLGFSSVMNKKMKLLTIRQYPHLYVSRCSWCTCHLVLATNASENLFFYNIAQIKIIWYKMIVCESFEGIVQVVGWEWREKISFHELNNHCVSKFEHTGHGMAVSGFFHVHTGLNIMNVVSWTSGWKSSWFTTRKVSSRWMSPLSERSCFLASPIVPHQYGAVMSIWRITYTVKITVNLN